MVIAFKYEKVVVKGEVIKSAVDRAKNNGLKLLGSTSKLDTRIYSLTVKTGTGFLKSLLNFSLNNCKNRVRGVYDYIRDGLEIAGPASGQKYDLLNSSSTLFSHLYFPLLFDNHTTTHKHLQQTLQFVKQITMKGNKGSAIICLKLEPVKKMKCKRFYLTYMLRYLLEMISL